jgi:hypothetical protein
MFIIRGYPRCGTEMLRTALDSHSKIKCHGGLFSDKHADTIAELGITKYLQSHKLAATDGLVLSAGPTTGNAVITAASKQLLTSAETLAIPMIAVQRQDLLRLAASDVIARTTGTYHVYLHEKPNRTTHTLVMTPPQLCRAVDNARRAFDSTSVLYPWAKIVMYEDLVRDWEDQLNDILDYIGVPHELIGAMTRRQEVRAIRNIVHNYEELKEQLYDSRPDIFDIAEAGDDLFK